MSESSTCTFCLRLYNF